MLVQCVGGRTKHRESNGPIKGRIDDSVGDSKKKIRNRRLTYLRHPLRMHVWTPIIVTYRWHLLS